jgi:hypothetical protein
LRLGKEAERRKGRVPLHAIVTRGGAAVATQLRRLALASAPPRGARAKTRGVLVLRPRSTQPAPSRSRFVRGWRRNDTKCFGGFGFSSLYRYIGVTLPRYRKKTILIQYRAIPS